MAVAKKQAAQEKQTMTTREDFYAAGKALRAKTPRKSHAAFNRPAGRFDPVRLLVASSKGRLAQLIPIRYGRMLPSPFTFYRGAADIMAADLVHTPDNGIVVQACGDCHLMNFGGFATPERRVIFDINDFDETHPAPWEWDVKRLAASFVIAGRNNNLKAVDCREAAAAAVRSYREHMAEISEMHVLEAWYSYIDLKALIETTKDPELLKTRRKRMKKLMSKNSPALDFSKLVEQRNGRPTIRENPPLIYHIDERKDPGFSRRVVNALNRYRDSLPHERRVLFDRYSLADIAIKVVGVGSVGTLCFAALFLSGVGDPLFLQIKEAGPSVLEPYTAKSLYKNQGQRVVVGQRIMQAASDIFLGWAQGDNARQFYFRQLRDAKVSALVETFEAQHLAEYGVACGWALARAHSRSGSAARLAGYMGKSDVFDEAIADFAVAYADQNERDYALFKRAVRSGKIEAQLGR
ncbi:MAG TPA: DUF2252 domain-containing protein [bacterium]|nr:DUF2252 domain-containing protein [bacterium]